MPREPIHTGCPELLLEVAFCNTLSRSDSMQDRVCLEGSSFYTDWTSSKAALWPGQKLWEPNPWWILQGIWSGQIPHNAISYPMGDGLVNRSILNLLHGLVHKVEDWEDYLQLLLYLYRTTKHATTGLSLYKILFGSNPPPLNLPTSGMISHLDPPDYSSLLQEKVVELKQLLDANTVEMANKQLQSYQSKEPIKLQEVLLDNPTKGKLDPCLTGPWRVRELKGPRNVKIKMDNKERVIHGNRGTWFTNWMF